MNPEKVNPRKFTKKIIIYNDNKFSIAYGKWENKSMRIAMRWNGDDNNLKDLGYPKAFGRHPLWFILPKNLVLPFLKTLIKLEHSEIKNIKSILKKIDEN